MRAKQNHNLSVIGALVFLVLLGAGGFYLYKKVVNKNTVIAFATTDGSESATIDVNASSTPPALSESTPATAEATAGMRLYQNAAFHFGLLFPNTLVAKEYIEQDGALTVSFQDPNSNQGFEVYVTPYSGKQIDTARFTLDEPSGTFLQPTNVVVGGTQATMFYGKNGIMGATREVWFIKGAFLYEVTTYKELDTWLGGIMQTWKFI